MPAIAPPWIVTTTGWPASRRRRGVTGDITCVPSNVGGCTWTAHGEPWWPWWSLSSPSDVGAAPRRHLRRRTARPPPQRQRRRPRPPRPHRRPRRPARPPPQRQRRRPRPPRPHRRPRRPAPRTTSAPATSPAPTSAAGGSSGVSYANCTAARAAGVTPLHRGEPGYSTSLDRDGDGIACE